MNSSTTSNTAALVLACAIIICYMGPVVSSPPMLRTACGLVADAEEAMGNKAMAAGKAAVDLAMKPIALVGGLKAAAVGTGMKVSGGAIKFVGAKMAKDGAILQAAGAGIKGAGLGVAAMSLKPAAEKIVEASHGAEAPINAVKNFANQVGDTSVQIDATLDSPVLGHHHHGVSISSDKHANQQQQQQIQQQQDVTKVEEEAKGQEIIKGQIEQQQAEQNSITKRAAPKIDVEVMKSALNLVKEAKMEDCVALAICDLNCNPQGFGQDGKQVFMNMVRLQGANVLEESESKYFHEAAAKGREYASKCEKCATHYDKCHSKSADLIKMASHIRMD